MIFTILFILFVGVILHWRKLRPKNFPPGPTPLPIVGNIKYALVPNLHIAMEEWSKIWGPLIGLVFPGQAIVAISDQKLVLEYVKHEDLQGRFFSFTISSIIKSRGIILNDADAHWSALKRFTLKNLRDLGFSRDNIIEQEFQKWAEYNMKKGPILEGHKLFLVPTMNILWEAICGKLPSYEDEEFSKVTASINDILRLSTAVGFISDVSPTFSKIAPKLTKYDVAIDRLNLIRSYCEKEVEAHDKTLNRENPRDLIDAFLIEVKDQKFTGNDLFAVLFDLYLGGSDTVSNTLSFAVAQMIYFPDVQKKVQKEIDNIIGENQITVQDRARLNYVEAVITEMRRFCPTVGFIPRKATKDTIINGYNIPNNTNILFNLRSLYHAKEHFGDPENFRPERFLDENGKYTRDDTLIFFGLGKRFCLGESLARKLEFIFFVSLLQKFDLSPPDGESKPSLYPESGFTFSPKPFNVKMTLRKRKYM